MTAKSPTTEAERAEQRANSHALATLWSGGIEVRGIHGDEATVVKLLLATDDGLQWSGQGTAKRAPGDQRNSDTGKKLALGRALLELGHRMINEANDQVAP